MTAETVLALLAPPEPVDVWTWTGAGLLLLLAGTCAVIVVTDLRERVILDECNLLVAALGLAAAGREGMPSALAALVQGCGAFGVFWVFRALYRRFRGRHGLGLGDVKFLGGAGTWVGLGGLPSLVLLASLAALVSIGLVRLWGRRISIQHAIPFGPFLVFGLLGVLAAGLLESR